MKRFFLICLAAMFTFAACDSKDEEQPTLSINAPEEVSITATGETKTFTITSNTAWTAISDSKWCKVTPPSGSGDGQIVVNVNENDDIKKRTAIVTISIKGNTKVITINQAAADQEILPDKNSYEVDAEGGTLTLTFQTNVEGNVQPEIGDDSWLHVAVQQGAVLERKTLKFTVDQNFSLTQRSNTIKLTGGTAAERTITVTQKSGEAYLSMEETDAYIITYNKDTLDVTYLTNLPATTVTPNNDWIQVKNNKIASGNGLVKGTITFTFDEHREAFDRTGSVTLKGEGAANVTITIKQTKAAGIMEITGKDRITVGAEEGVFTLNVSANGTTNLSDYKVTIASGGTWITQVANPAQGSVMKDLAFKFKASENKETTGRQTTITIELKEDPAAKVLFTIVQLQPGASIDQAAIIELFTALDIEGCDPMKPLPWTVATNKAVVSLTSQRVSMIEIGSTSDASIAPRGYISPALGELTELTNFKIRDFRQLKNDEKEVKATDVINLTKVATLEFYLSGNKTIDWVAGLPTYNGKTTLSTTQLALYCTEETGTAFPSDMVVQLKGLTSSLNIFGNFTGNLDFTKGLKSCKSFEINNVNNITYKSAFTGSFEKISEMTSVTAIRIKNCPELTGPMALPGNKAFANLAITNCPKVGGALPAFDNSYTGLTSIHLIDCGFTGSIPESYKTLFITQLFLQGNKLSGNLPDMGSIGRPGQFNLDLSNNNFTGDISNLKFNNTVVNSAAGTATVARANSLNINISNNQITGELTTEVLNNIYNTTNNTNYLNFANNQLTGDLTGFDGVVNGSAFKFAIAASPFDLSGNKFYGPVSTKLKSLTKKVLCPQATPEGKDPLYWADDETNKTAICQ